MMLHLWLGRRMNYFHPPFVQYSLFFCLLDVASSSEVFGSVLLMCLFSLPRLVCVAKKRLLKEEGEEKRNIFKLLKGSDELITTQRI